jgi:diguanylate cyclase (GGDEF)-like protein
MNLRLCTDLDGSLKQSDLVQMKWQCGPMDIGHPESGDIDQLTGLPSRRALFAFGERHSGRAIESDGFIGCMIIDLDRFVLINHFLGHEVGDQVLIEVAVRISNAVRSGDLVGRIGGDEFCVLLPGTRAIREVETVAMEVLRTFDTFVEIGDRELTLDNERNPYYSNPAINEHAVQTSASIGLTISKPGDTFMEILCNADDAVSQAKREGRSRIRIYARD